MSHGRQDVGPPGSAGLASRAVPPGLLRAAPSNASPRGDRAPSPRRRPSPPAGTSRGRGDSPLRVFELLAVKLLAKRDRTEAEVRAFLERKGASAAVSRSVVHRLVQRGYLNDTVCAQRWAEARLRRHPMGQARLEAELLAKGIDAITARQTVQRLYGNETERELAERRVRARAAGRAPLDPARAAALLRRDGFAEDVIAEVTRPELNEPWSR